MIKVSLRQILEARPGLMILAQSKVPFRTGMVISRLIKAINPELKVFEDVRSTILEAAGNKLTEEATAEIEEALSSEIELLADQIDVNDIQSIELTVGQIDNLMPFIKQ